MKSQVSLSPIPSRHASLKRIARAVSWTVAFGLLLAFGGSVHSLIAPHAISSFIGLSDACLTPDPVSGNVRLRLFFALLPGLILFSIVAIRIRTLFRRFSRGVILDQTNARQLSTIGWLVIAGGILSMAQRTLFALALTLDHADGRKQLVISLSTSDVFLVLFGLFVLAFAHVIGEGARIADENRGFV